MRWKDFDLQFWSRNASTAKVSDIRLKSVGPNRNVLSAVRTILTKDAGIEKQENQSVPIVRGHMLRHTKGVRNTKKRPLGNIWLTTKNLIPQL